MSLLRLLLLLLLGPLYRRVSLVVVDGRMLILRPGVGIVGSIVRVLRSTLRGVHPGVVVVSVLVVGDLLEGSLLVGRELLRVGRLLVVMAAGALMILVLVLVGLLLVLEFIGSPRDEY